MPRYITNFSTLNLPSENIDTIIVGSGLAGLSVAKKLIDLGERPLILAKKPIERTNSFLAQGGIAAAVSIHDNPDKHKQDTLKAGKGLSNEENVKILVEEGLERILELISSGVPFDRKNGCISLTKEGAHSLSRILHVKDKTGEFLTKHFYQEVLNKAHIQYGYFLEEILVEDGRFYGVIVSNKKEKKVIYAKSLVLATGGYSPLFKRNTSAYFVGGDTLLKAFRAGCELEDLEFIQFHPTALDMEGEPAFLLTEALRGEGALLVDENGERFVDELKPRDEVARSIYKKIQEGKKVYLDLKPIEEKGISIKERFPNIYSLISRYNLQHKIPVSPAAHFTMGGIRAGVDGTTGISGIFAVGEVACTEVHGANRLASNSLLECITFGTKTGYSVYKYNMYTDIKEKRFENKTPFHEISPEERKRVINSVKELLWKHCGVVRDRENLEKGLNQISMLHNLYENISCGYVKDILKLGKLVIKSALDRQESRGSHYRSDFPIEKDELKKHSIIKNKS